jgi:GNAT superfamily N-acetyltransferase
MNDEPTFMKLSFPWAVPSSALDVCFHFVRCSYKGELFAIYLLDKYQRQGIGRAPSLLRG